MEPGGEAADACADLGTTHDLSLYWGCGGAWLGRGLVSREGQTQDEGRRGGAWSCFAASPPHFPCLSWCVLSTAEQIPNPKCQNTLNTVYSFDFLHVWRFLYCMV